MRQKADENGCAPGDRHCTVQQSQGDSTPVVWVGPNDGKWIKIVENEDAPRPCPSVKSFREETAEIFAAIASFRDSLCGTTLHGLFSRAKFPERVTVGVIQQNLPEDDDCLESYCKLSGEKECPYRSQILMKRFAAGEAKGPTWARAQDRDLLPDTAEFCLRTDSHMAFAQDWDVKQIRQWRSAENEFAILSTYVADATQIRDDGSEVNVNGKWEVPHLCSILWQDGHVRNMQAKAARNLRKPKLTTLWAAGLSFAKCHAERTVPYDPETPYIFWGEEFSRTARFFTNGYDIYTPDRTIIAHDYKHTQGDPTHFKWNGKGGPRILQNKTIRAQREKANKRIWALLGMPGGDPDVVFGQYGLGSVRSLDQLIDFTGINLRNRSITRNRCGNIDWVPWDCQSHPLAAAIDNDPSRPQSLTISSEPPALPPIVRSPPSQHDPEPPPKQPTPTILPLGGSDAVARLLRRRHPSAAASPQEETSRNVVLPGALVAVLACGCCLRFRIRQRRRRRAASKVF